MPTTEIKHLLHISASVSEVFKMISTIEGIQKWWTVQTYGQDQEGGLIHFDFSKRYQNAFRVTKRVEDHHLVWKCESGAEDWIGSEVSFQLDESDGKTRVRFSHYNFQELNDFMAGCSFTWARYLISLRDVCEGREGDPFKE